MDLTQPENNYIYIDSNSLVDELCENLEQAESVAIDTECDSLFHYFEKVCLLQLSFGGQNYLVDTLSKIKLNHILHILANKRIIVHCGDYDFRMMKKCYGFKPCGEVFDTWIAARLLGLPKVSLTDLASELVDLDLPKGAQKSDWSKRPLSDKQIDYAVKDTCYLEQIADILTGRLTELDRMHWMKDCVGEMMERACFNDEEEAKPDPARQWRIKGLRGLNRRQLEYVRRLWYWRDTQSRKLDRPPFKVLANAAIINIAVWASTHPGESVRNAKKVRLPGNLNGKKYEELCWALDLAAETSEKELPPIRLPNDNSDYDEDYSYINLEPYQKAAKKVAKRLNIEAPLLVTRSQWYKILNSFPGELDDILVANDILPWKFEYIKEILDIVDSSK